MGPESGVLNFYALLQKQANTQGNITMETDHLIDQYFLNLIAYEFPGAPVKMQILIQWIEDGA